MRKNLLKLAVCSALALAGVASQAAVITFDGGSSSGNVTHYIEDGFRLSFVGDLGFVGDYYSAGNNVVHAHWSEGGIAAVTSIEITKEGGGTFDLNYFILTSNTMTGGGPASGTEQAWIEGFAGGVSTGAAVLLPPEDWGFPATQVFLGSNFDTVDTVKFYVTNAVACFGMDEFYIDEAAPSEVPEPGSLALLGLGIAGLAAIRRRKRA